MQNIIYSMEYEYTYMIKILKLLSVRYIHQKCRLDECICLFLSFFYLKSKKRHISYLLNILLTFFYYNFSYGK